VFRFIVRDFVFRFIVRDFVFRFIVRDFVYNEEELEAGKSELKKLASDKSKQFVSCIIQSIFTYIIVYLSVSSVDVKLIRQSYICCHHGYVC